MKIVDATFRNLSGAELVINRTMDEALRIDIVALFENTGNFEIGSTSSIWEYGILLQGSSSIDNNSDGTMEINRSTISALRISGGGFIYHMHLISHL